MNNLMRNTIQTGSDRIWIKETYEATNPPTSLSEHNFDVAFFVVWCNLVCFILPYLYSRNSLTEALFPLLSLHIGKMNKIRGNPKLRHLFP